MPKMKTHKGIKKRFKVTATGKVMHKRCGSSHLNSHKSGGRIRKLRKKSIIKIGAEARRLRHALRTRESAAPHQPLPVEIPVDDAAAAAPESSAPAAPQA